MKPDSITIRLLSGSDIIVLSKPEGSKAFITAKDSFIISRSTFILLLNYLVDNEIISPAILEGILEERFTK